jgi:hypothetical protein
MLTGEAVQGDHLCAAKHHNTEVELEDGALVAGIL